MAPRRTNIHTRAHLQISTLSSVEPEPVRTAGHQVPTLSTLRNPRAAGGVMDVVSPAVLRMAVLGSTDPPIAIRLSGVQLRRSHTGCVPAAAPVLSRGFEVGKEGAV